MILIKIDIILISIIYFMKKITLSILLLIISSYFLLTGCNKKDLNRDRPLSAEDKRKQNIKEGRGASLGSVLGSRGGTNYEFSSSNPMWRATLETLDFLPLATVDYSGGVVITDWYSENNSADSIKITIRFLSNEIRSDGLKIIVHKKKCKQSLGCTTSLSSSNRIKDELLTVILKKAALFEKANKKKK